LWFSVQHELLNGFISFTSELLYPLHHGIISLSNYRLNFLFELYQRILTIPEIQHQLKGAAKAKASNLQSHYR